MTPTEKQFFKKLCKAVEPLNVVVAPQVAMSAIVDVPRQFNENKFRHKNRAGFAQKRLDFVLLDIKSLEPILVVELDDPSHDGREFEDSRRDDILAETGHPLLRIDVRENLTTEQLAQRVLDDLMRG